MIECGSCGAVYVFRTIDWDDGQDNRIFSLAPIHGSFADLKTDLKVGIALEPGWTVWVVPCGDEEVDDWIEQVERASSPIEFVVASHDLLKEIDVWSPSRLLQEIDWFDRWGISRAFENC